jgi:hypothetical protein
MESIKKYHQRLPLRNLCVVQQSELMRIPQSIPKAKILVLFENLIKYPIHYNYLFNSKFYLPCVHYNL